MPSNPKTAGTAKWRRKPIQRWFAPPASDNILLRTDEVSSWLGISRHTLRWWRRSKRGPAHTLLEGKPRYFSGEVRQYIDAQATQARAAANG